MLSLCFQSYQKYYGCESPVGHNVRQLREVYHSAHQEALTQTGSFLWVTENHISNLYQGVAVTKPRGMMGLPEGR